LRSVKTMKRRKEVCAPMAISSQWLVRVTL
jgi:hypothetical protein